MNESVLFLLQRVTAAILAPLVVLHLIVILYAVTLPKRWSHA